MAGERLQAHPVPPLSAPSASLLSRVGRQCGQCHTRVRSRARLGGGATSTPCRWPPTFLNGPRTVFRRCAIPKSTLRCAWPSPPLSTQISALMCCPQGRGAFFKTAKGLTPGSERPAQVQASSNRSAVPREGDVATDSGTSTRLCHGGARAGRAPFVHRAPFLDLHVSRP